MSDVDSNLCLLPLLLHLFSLQSHKTDLAMKMIFYVNMVSSFYYDYYYIYCCCCSCCCCVVIVDGGLDIIVTCKILIFHLSVLFPSVLHVCWHIFLFSTVGFSWYL